MGDRLQEKTGDKMHKLKEHSPNPRQIMGLIALLVGAVAVLTIGGFTLAGIAIAVVVGFPIFLFFSPVLVPLGFMLFLGATGLFLAAATFVAFFSFVSWTYNYFKGRHPVGSDKIDAARHRIMGSVHHATEKGREYGSYVGSKAQEAAPGA